MIIKSRYSKASSRITKRSRVRYFGNLFVKAGLSIFLLVMIVILLRADFLQLKKVEVVGNKDIKTEEVVNLAAALFQGKYLFLIPKSNLLLFKKSALNKKVLADLPRVENLEISKNLSGILEIKLQERQGDFIWCSDSEICYLMSKNGLVFMEASKEEAQAKIVFRGNIFGNPLFQNFATEAQMTAYLEAVKILQNANLEVFEINVELADKAAFKTNIGNIFLNPEENLSSAAQNAVILINDAKVKDSAVKFDYIDARFGNKVFYKPALRS